MKKPKTNADRIARDISKAVGGEPMSDCMVAVFMTWGALLSQVKPNEREAAFRCTMLALKTEAEWAGKEAGFDGDGMLADAMFKQMAARAAKLRPFNGWGPGQEVH